MAVYNLTINGKQERVEVDPQMPLLWVIRDFVGLTGTKYGCGIAQCGACTVHLDGNPIRACVLPVSAIGTRQIVTIEGLSENNDHPVQQAWIDEPVPQCGYCQSGQIMAAAALLAEKKSPSEEEINQTMNGLICRCGTYPRIKKAIKRAAELS